MSRTATSHGCTALATGRALDKLGVLSGRGQGALPP